jgi:alginate O-acetyltransferase complex protein AlgI
MPFNTLTFILFFAIVLLLYHLSPYWSLRKTILLGASYVFYCAWNPPFVVLILISTMVDWVAAQRIYLSQGMARQLWLTISLCANLGLLAYFKYAAFFMESFIALAKNIGFEYQPAPLDIILPMGISFYTFQTLSYTVDIYRDRAKPATSFLDYALFVTFFPQLVAGPIVRAVDFLPQCLQLKRFNAQQLGWGLILLTLGLFQKSVMADYVFAPTVDRIFAEPGALSLTSAWIGSLAFSGQIFCDFAGYSSCGIGIALCLGFALPDNFRFPYAAIGFSDFWRRWHISLSAWLRDYLYISLGGNRNGRLRGARNLMLTMLIGGLWHGAGWNFVVWGGLHGLYLIGERVVIIKMRQWPVWDRRELRILLAILTFLLVTITWVFFRADSFEMAGLIIHAMFGGNAWTSPVSNRMYASVTGMLALLFIHWKLRESSLEDFLYRMSDRTISIFIALALIAIAIIKENNRGFIYFQF